MPTWQRPAELTTSITPNTRARGAGAWHGQRNAVEAHHTTSKVEATSAVGLLHRNERYMHVVSHKRDSEWNTFHC